MPDPTSQITTLERPPALTLWTALRRPEQWWQLIQFGLVGSSGFVVNFAVYAMCLKVFGLHYLASAVIAFCVAVANNFLLNRHWTFRRYRDASHAATQGVRFLIVSACALVPNLLILQLLVSAGHGKIAGQVIAVIIVTPISFLGNKLWTFR
jgi:dolichol-phosphate mannosyltransferase